ncbi:putative integral membrane protein [Acanthocheilonema viteae]|uniref:Uncharacterized protein n=1 Tax=Acanthocheilonema viteae TaxID=6277 RepID=A0A498SLU8_ACAVI|nr:unnamed protein product [Acanthocheilonema viteae]
MTSSGFILCILLIAQGVQGWWYPGSYGYGYGYGYHGAPFFHPYGGYAPYNPGYHHPAYHNYHVNHAISTNLGASVGAALGSLAASVGKKK